MGDTEAEVVESTQSDLEHVSDWIAPLAETLGVNVVRSLSKAIERFFVAGADRAFVDWEIGARDKRAQQKARETILDKLAVAAGDKAARDPALVTTALNRLAGDLVREQVNSIDVLMQAKEQLELNPPEQDAEKEIDDTWLNHFYDLVKHKSSETAQAMFAKAFAEEVKKPGSFSIKTLRIIGEMPDETGDAFQKLCNLSIELGGLRSVICDPYGKPGNNSLGELGLNFVNLSYLVDENLIISDLNTGYPLDTSIGQVMRYANVDIFISEDANFDGEVNKDRRLSALLFTVAGKEVASIMTITEHRPYTKKLFEWFKAKGLILNYVTERQGDTIFCRPMF